MTSRLLPSLSTRSIWPLRTPTGVTQNLSPPPAPLNPRPRHHGPTPPPDNRPLRSRPSLCELAHAFRSPIDFNSTPKAGASAAEKRGTSAQIARKSPRCRLQQWSQPLMTVLQTLPQLVMSQKTRLSNGACCTRGQKCIGLCLIL